MATPTEEFLASRNDEIEERMEEIRTQVAELDDQRCTLCRELATLRKERNGNLVRMGIPVRARKAVTAEVRDE